MRYKYEEIYFVDAINVFLSADAINVFKEEEWILYD